MPELFERGAAGFSKICPAWSGCAVVIIGGGPSLSLDDVEVLRVARAARDDLRVIAINDAYLLAPWADLLYFADIRWWHWHHAGIARPGLSAQEVAQRLREFPGLRASVEQQAGSCPDPKAYVIRHGRMDGLSDNPERLNMGGHSGVQAANLAVLAGARPIYLLGFDGQKVEDKTHWFGDHPVRERSNAYELYRNGWRGIQNDLRWAGIECWNCTKGAYICFPYKPLAEALRNEA